MSYDGTLCGFSTQCPYLELPVKMKLLHAKPYDICQKIKVDAKSCHSIEQSIDLQYVFGLLKDTYADTHGEETKKPFRCSNCGKGF